MSDSVYWVSCQLKKKRTSTITDGQGKVYLQYQFRWEDVLCFSNAAEIQSKLPLRLPVRQESRTDETGLGVATYAFGNSIFFALNGHPKSYGLALQDHKKVFSGSGCPFLVGFQVDSGVMQSFWPDKQYLNVLEGLEPRLFYPSPPKRWYFASGTVFGAIEVAP
jgi:hypothetical protein